MLIISKYTHKKQIWMTDLNTNNTSWRKRVPSVMFCKHQKRVTIKYQVNAVNRDSPQGMLRWCYIQHTFFYFLDKLSFLAVTSCLSTSVLNIQSGPTNKAIALHLLIFLKWIILHDVWDASTPCYTELMLANKKHPRHLCVKIYATWLRQIWATNTLHTLYICFHYCNAREENKNERRK